MTVPQLTKTNDQAGHRVRFEWGREGMAELAPHVDVVIVVDVLSFTTCVDIALGRGGVVLPYPSSRDGATAFAESVDAAVASSRRDAGTFSLSPASLDALPKGTRLVLPSPNGAALLFGAVAAGADTVVAACIRNGAAIGSWFADQDVSVAVIAAGERWGDADTPIRVAIEDLWGAGCVLSLFEPADLSPEARVAANAWRAVEADIVDELQHCSSGRELVFNGFETDVQFASAAHVSDSVPVLVDQRFVDLTGVG